MSFKCQEGSPMAQSRLREMRDDMGFPSQYSLLGLAPHAQNI